MPSIKEVSHKGNNKLHSKENRASYRETGETGETSFRVYYGATGAAVPFVWESQPGTPKHPIFSKSHDENSNINTLPPLTPPPSYTTSPLNIIGQTSTRRQKSSSRIFDVILSTISRKSSNVTPTSSSSSPLSWSTSSSSSSSLSSPRFGGRKKGISHRRSISFCSMGAKSSLFDDEVDSSNMGSPNTSLCLGFKKKQHGCYSMKNVKNVIFSSRRGH